MPEDAKAEAGIHFKANRNVTMDCGIRHNDKLFGTYIY